MAKEWYRNIAGSPSGPLSSLELQELAQSGQLKPDDLVCLSGASDWMPASRIKGLKFADPSFSVNSKPDISPNISTTNTSTQPTLKRPKPAWLIPSIVAAAVCVVTVSVTAAILLSKKDSSQQISNTDKKQIGKSSGYDTTNERAEKLHDELQNEREKLRKQIRNLEEHHDKMERENRDLQDQKDKLDREIKDLVTKLEFLKQWQNADFVLVNPSHFSVALKDTGGALRVISEGEGELAELALGACRNWHIPRMVDDATLTRNVFQQVDQGDLIPQHLETAIRKEYWKPRRFVPIPHNTKTSDLKLVVFRDLESYKYRMGYSLGTDQKGIDFYPLGTRPERIPWSKIQPGSARSGRAEEVLRTIGDVDFLEYCILRIAQKLGSTEKDGKMQPNARPSIFVHVDIDIPNDHVNFYKQLDNQLMKQGEPPTYVEAKGALGILAFLVDLGVRTSVPARRKALYEEMLRTDPNRRARHLSRYVEDEVMARLSQCGIAPISKRDQELLTTSEIQEALQATSHHDATHLLAVTVKNARGSADYHLSLRLYREDGKEVWTDEGDRVLNTTGVGNQYHVVSGRPAIVYLKKDTFKKFQGIESPPIMPSIKNRSIAEKYSHLVYLENKPESPIIQHRTLFQSEVFNTPRDQFKSVSLIETVDDVPQEHILRYVTNRIAEAILPAAGLVVQTNGQAAVATLGKRNGVQAGDRLRVVRARHAPTSLAQTGKINNRYFGLSAHGEFLLPTELTVTEAAEYQCTLAVSSTGLENEWPENVSLQENDLVLARANGTRIVSVETPITVPPSPHITTKLRLNTNRIVRQKYELNTRLTAVQVTELIESALTNLQIPVISQTTNRRTYNRKKGLSNTGLKATHRVYGTITLSPKINVKARASATPYYRLEIKVSPAQSDEIVEQFNFDLKDFVRPSK